MIEKGQWMVLPYKAVRNLPNLRLSPIGVVPQRERRPRTIVDYTFFGVNDETIPLTAPESMQFGKALHRIIQAIVRADPRHGPVHIIKVDVADGFYRIHLAPCDIPTLGVTLPFSHEGEPLIAFPLTLPMGWVNSPPLFCSATETVCDLANQQLDRRTRHPTHRLDALADTEPLLSYRHHPPFLHPHLHCLHLRQFRYDPTTDPDVSLCQQSTFTFTLTISLGLVKEASSASATSEARSSTVWMK